MKPSAAILSNAARWCAGLPARGERPRPPAGWRRVRASLFDLGLVLWTVAAVRALFPALFA